MLCFMFSFCGCDYTQPLQVNGGSSYKIKTECGNIEVHTNLFSRQIFISQKFEGRGFLLNTDSLVVLFPAQESNYITEKYYIDAKGGKINDSKNNINYPQKLTLKLEFNEPLFNGQLMILPCGYIKCNGVSLIRDTIKVNR